MQNAFQALVDHVANAVSNLHISISSPHLRCMAHTRHKVARLKLSARFQCYFQVVSHVLPKVA